MYQIPNFLCLNPITIICASCNNIYFTFMVIKDGFSGETTLKTFKKNRPNFSIWNTLKWNISSGAPGTYLMSHTAEKLLAMRFFWCIALVRAQKFLLSSFLGGVPPLWPFYSFQWRTRQHDCPGYKEGMGWEYYGGKMRADGRKICVMLFTSPALPCELTRANCDISVIMTPWYAVMMHWTQMWGTRLWWPVISGDH